METKEEIPEYTVAEAVAEASRCLNCPKPLCKTGCPISNDIPQFNHALSIGNIGEAYRIISAKSNLPAICGRVCPHENQCEGHCVLAKSGKGIKIGRIERFIADFYIENEMAPKKVKPAPKKNVKIAVVGGGPAGITAAGDLASQGFDVTIYEGNPEAGGVLLYGIPDFRLPKDVVRREVKKLEALGVTFVTDTIVGKDITIDQLMDEKGFKAVFIGSGADLSNSLDLPGKELDGVIQSDYFLHQVRLYNDGKVSADEVPVKEGDEVVVIGAGNVAMDACRTAVRMKAAKVTVCYRKTIDFMKAARAEYDGAVSDGVEFRWQHVPDGYEGKDGKVTGFRVSTPDGEKKVVPANKILVSVGSQPDGNAISGISGIETDEKGYYKVSQKPYGMTTKKGVFAAGDAVHKPATVVLAMREAKKTAAGIVDYLAAKELLGE